MSWRRGFFRLWVLLTGLWVLVMGVVWLQPITNPRPYDCCRYFVHNAATDAVTEIHTGSKEYDALMQGKTDGRVNLVEVQPNATPNYLPAFNLFLSSSLDDQSIPSVLDKALKAYGEEYGLMSQTARSTAISGAAASILLPPIIILGLGVAIAWVLSGFRGRSRQGANGPK